MNKKERTSVKYLDKFATYSPIQMALARKRSKMLSRLFE
jgi:hypothetical protein